MTVEDQNSPPGETRPATACSNSQKQDEDAVAVRVAVNIRPLVEQELAKGCQEILDVAPGAAQVTACGSFEKALAKYPEATATSTQAVASLVALV